MAGLEATLGHRKLVGVTLLHYLLLHRLVGSADPIAIHIGVEVIHSLNLGKHTANHKVVLVEDMLSKGLLCRLSHQFDTEATGMDGQHLVEHKGLGLLPGEYPALGKITLVADRSVAHTVGMYVEVVGNCKVHTAVFVALLKLIEEGGEISAQNVVRVNHLKVFTRCSCQTLVNSLTVTAILLMNDTND